MQLIGMMDSPFVRRVAVTLHLRGIEFEHRPLSVFRDFDRIRAIAPMVKVPTLVLDDGQTLIDSTLILDYLDGRPEGRDVLERVDEAGRVHSLRVLGTCLAALEKAAFLIYERTQRPVEKQHGPWIDRTVSQLAGACAELESMAPRAGPWLFGDRPSQADITLAVAWRFIQLRSSGDVAATDHPALVAFSARAEALPAFRACPVE